jgi:DNA-binding response OmpR family regulator
MHDITFSNSRPGILLVDAEPYLLTALALGLCRQGFKVWVAGHGLVAWQLYERHHAEIDFVLIDADMPGLDGAATLELLRGIDPDVQCWFMTNGAGNPPENQQAQACGGFHKPFSLDEVLDTLGLAARR